MKLSNIILLLFCALSISLSAQEKIPKKARKLFEEYKEAIRYNDFPKAIRSLEQAIEIVPDYLDAHRELGYYYKEVGAYGKAFNHFSHIVIKHPSSGSTPVFISGELAYLSGQYDSAHVYLSKYLEKGNLIYSMKEKANRYLTNIDFALKAKANPVDFKPENLGPEINTPLLEYLPSFSADNEKLIFTRRLSSNGRLNEDFFISKRVQDKWTKARNLGEPVNTLQNEGAHSLSANGKYIYFTRCGDAQPGRGGYGGCDIYRTRMKGNLWGAPRNMGRTINSNGWESQPCMSADGMTLYFTSNRKGGFGGKDIWYTRLQDGMWSEPINLGPNINTPGNEESPFIHPDNQTLYFSSDHHVGMGDYDYFIARKKSNGEWDMPVNFGYPVNSVGFELGIYVTTDGEYAYFASDRFEGYGGLDIYRFKLNEKLKPKPVTYVKGKVISAKTKKNIKANIELIDLESNETIALTNSDEINGEYLVCLPAGKMYALNVSKKNYLFHSENFSLIDYKSEKPFKINVRLKPIKTGSAVVLKNIFFETGSYELKTWSRTELDKLTEFLMENEGVKIEIAGHTDNIGSADFNQKLSENRAKSVYTYLLDNNIEENRLSYKGYGDQKPVSSNDSEEGRAKNRRTEFKIIEAN